MSKLQLFNDQFVVDDNMLSDRNALIKLIQRSKHQVIFHLQCALSAFDKQNALRYLPNPMTYYHMDKHHWAEFISFIRNSTDLASFLSDGYQARTDFELHALLSKLAEGKHYRTSIIKKLLYFTLFTCDLVLTDYRHNDFQVFLVQCSNENESEFRQSRSSSTLLFHYTDSACVYSICRNGIKPMSNEGAFCTNGASYGHGIYMRRSRYVPGCNNTLLCYSVRHADSRKVADDVYLLKESDVCLRAIIQSKGTANSCLFTLDQIMKVVQEHHYAMD